MFWKRDFVKWSLFFVAKKIPAIKAGNNLCSRGWNCNIIARTIFLPQYSIWLFRLLVFSNGSPMNTNTISLICFLLLVDSDNTIPVAISLSQHNTWSVSAIMVPVVRYCVVIVSLPFSHVYSLLGSNDDNIADKLDNILGGFNVLTHGFILHNIYFTCLRCPFISTVCIGWWLCGYWETVCTTPIPPFLTASS